MIAIAVAIGFLVIFLSMYTTITERTREIGILKSLGASKGYIIDGYPAGSGLAGFGGILAGYGGAVIGRKVVLAAFPTLSVDLTVGMGALRGSAGAGGKYAGRLLPGAARGPA